MKFAPETTTTQLPNHHLPLPNRMDSMSSTGIHQHEPHDGLTDLDGVARALGVSKRFVQSLIKRKIIPVIRLGRRCNRFDLDRVLAAVKKYEVEEYGRR